MGIDIGTLANNADHLDACRCNHVEHHVSSLRETAIARLHGISFPAEPGIGRQFLETIEKPLKVALSLLAPHCSTV